MNKSIADNAMSYTKGEVTVEKVEPDTIAYSSKFYAKHHIPSYQERPGNNTINNEIYNKYKPDFNLYCYKQ
jgi:hypothetical protein